MAVPSADALRAVPRSAGGSRTERRASRLMVAAQVAIALTLVAGASLFATNLHRLQTAPAGFDRHSTLLVHADALFAGHTGPALLRFYDAALERLAALPGAESASYSKVPPVSHDLGAWTEPVAADGSAPPAGDDQAYLNAISPGYFTTTGTSLVAGRAIDRGDRAGSQPVVVVNQTLAARTFAGSSPLGRYLTLGVDDRQRRLLVVGIVEDAKYEHLQEAPRSTAYLPVAQAAAMLGDDNLVLEVRATGSPAALSAAAREALGQMDANLPVRVETLEARIAESLVRERALTGLAVPLGAIALVLAAAALYGTMAYAVTARTRELGVRAALGATPGAIRRLVLAEAARIGVAGVVVGLLLAAALGRYAGSLLFAVAPNDPLVLVGAAGLVLGVALAAALGPARRGARADVCDALRVE